MLCKSDGIYAGFEVQILVFGRCSNNSSEQIFNSALVHFNFVSRPIVLSVPRALYDEYRYSHITYR